MDLQKFPVIQSMWNSNTTFRMKLIKSLIILYCISYTCAHVRILMYVCACACIWACIWRPEVTASFLMTLHLIFEIGPLTDAVAH